MLNQLLKLGIGGLASLTSLGASRIIVSTVLLPEGSVLWISGRLVAAAFVVAVGVLTALYVYRPSALRTELLLLEAWAIMINLMMTAQGAATIWHLWHHAPRATFNGAV